MPLSSFDAHLTALALQGLLNGAANAAPGVARRAWSIPPAYPLGVDVQDPAGFTAGCARADLNDACVAAYETGQEPNAGRLGVVMACKVAIGHVAGYERAAHARHASAVRCRAWASARRSGHSDLTYGVFGAVGRYVDDLTGTAAAIPNAQT